MTRCVIYARVSSEMQAEDETPIAGQLAECQAYAESRGWEVVDIYKDEGFTGRNTDRPAFQKMMADAHPKPIPFEKIIVWKGSRIARNTEDRLACQSLLARKGIDIVSVKEPEFEGSIKVLMLPIMAAIDEYQSCLIGEDTVRGMKTLARQGYSTGGRPPKGYRARREPIGLKKNGEPRFRVVWEPDPELRDKAIKAFQMVAEGRSSDDIIKETGVVKDRSGLPSYFRNPTFIGERVFNVHRRKNGRVIKFSLNDPEVIHVPKAHEAIIPHELYDKVQAILEKRRPQPGQIRASKHDFVLSGLLWCEKHNCGITGSGNKEHRYYVCESFRRHGRKESDCRSIKKEGLEKFILDILKNKVFTHEQICEAVKYLINTMQDEDKRTQDELNSLKARIAKLKREVDGLNQGMINAGLFPQSTMKLVTEREVEISKLDKQLAEIKNSDIKSHTLRNMATYDEKIVRDIQQQIYMLLDSESPEHLRTFLRNYIEKIKMEGDSISIHFKFRESPNSSQEMVAGVGFEPTTFGL
jgi:site-specific DNA recombinase